MVNHVLCYLPAQIASQPDLKRGDLFSAAAEHKKKVQDFRAVRQLALGSSLSILLLALRNLDTSHRNQIFVAFNCFAGSHSSSFYHVLDTGSYGVGLLPFSSLLSVNHLHYNHNHQRISRVSVDSSPPGVGGRCWGGGRQAC